jgi:hypothetical protein
LKRQVLALLGVQLLGGTTATVVPLEQVEGVILRTKP